jgi:hypothetical protein
MLFASAMPMPPSSNPAFPPKRATPMGWLFLAIGYEKDIFAGFAYDFELTN